MIIHLHKIREAQIPPPVYTEATRKQKANKTKEDCIMKLFQKKEKIILWSEEEKLAFVEKLEKAHIKYSLREDRDVVSGEHAPIIIRINAEDLSKVV